MGKDHALIFIGQKRSGDAAEQQDHANDDQQVGQECRRLVPQHPGDTTLVALHAAIKPAIESTEEAETCEPMRRVMGLEHRGAQGRREHQRGEHRQGHRRHDGEGKLTVDDAG
ncbi:hypothetical protein D3C84_965920 [compost metagenome]